MAQGRLPVPLYYVWQYTDVDRAFWREHLEGWLPGRIIDAHVHMTNEDLCLEPMTEAMRTGFWVSEATRPLDAPGMDRCMATVFPGRDVRCIAIGPPSLAYDTDAHNDYVRAECLARGWHALAVLLPAWSQEKLAEVLDRPGVIGVKPYYTLISHDRLTRDKHLEAGVFDYLTHEHLEVLNERRAWVTLHVPKADRLPHPDNIRDVQEIRRRYPGVRLVVAHLGRCYTLPHAQEGLPPVADDPGLVFDISAVLNPEVLRLALELFGPQRLLYGTDNPVFYMHGRRQWKGRRYINRTSYDFDFNKNEHEPPQVEARYTLFMYEQLRAIRQVCQELGHGPDVVRALFHDNAARLLGEQAQ